MPKFGRNQRRSAPQRGRNGARMPQGASVPVPMLRSNLIMSHTFRFTSASNSALAVTANSLIGVCGVKGTVLNTLTSALFDSVRVKSVKIWSPPSAQGAAVTCSVLWASGVNSPAVEVSDTSVSTAVPAHITSTPPPQSLASFWQRSAATTIFTTVAPVGSIIDVALEMILSDDDGGLPVTFATATAALGQNYYLALDGVAVHQYTPVSLTTTF